MALEDRCSPQSAPSPPGIPHSPQSTSSPLVLDMSLHGQSSPSSNYSNPCTKYQGNNGITDIQNFDSKMSLSIRHYDSISSQYSDAAATIKEEEDSIISDHDQENDHESISGDQIPQQPQPLPVISFSITNILSDRFGKKQRTLTEKKSSTTIFRPFEVSKPNVYTSPLTHDRNSAFTRLSSEAIDYSRSTVNNSHHTHAAMIVERANFLNCFNPAAYPRIHEEILNSTRKFKQHQQHLYQHQSQSNDVTIPPLGSLCKTVSQIGQPPGTVASSITAAGICISSPPPAVPLLSSSVSPSSSSVTSPPQCRLPNSPQPIPPQQSISRDSGMESSDDTRSETGSTKDDNGQTLWPAWVYCTRYSDRPSSGPRYRRPKKPKDKTQVDEKRPRTAFSNEQLARLKREFNENRYLTEKRRQQLSAELGLNEAQIKIWFQNKRAKIKKSSGTKNPLALQLMAQGLYNHSTVPLTKEEEELEMRMNGQIQNS